MSDVTIRGLQEAQRANLRRIANMKPSGEFGNTLKEILTQLHRYQISIIHVDTGALRASIRVEINGLSGRTTIDEAATNPHGGRPWEYGYIEDKRGGSHAFGRRTVSEASPRIIGTAVGRLGRSLT